VRLNFKFKIDLFLLIIKVINMTDRKEYKKQYYQDNKEHIKNTQQIYRDLNREEINKKKKEYRDNNKEEISRKKAEKITCECGTIISKQRLARHRRTQKHIKEMEILELKKQINSN